jgi:sigma-B regulation protein RsbU (phosphoserine phosphatase)
MALGVIDDAAFEQRTVQFRPGDLVLFYTDGITEALDEQERDFGVQRLRRVLVQRQRAPVMDIVEAIERALEAHVGELAPFDDITMVAVRRR